MSFIEDVTFGQSQSTFLGNKPIMSTMMYLISILQRILILIFFFNLIYIYIRADFYYYIIKLFNNHITVY
jgi:hypothetical protein